MGTVSLGKSGREDRTVLVFLLEALPAALTLCSFSLSTMGFFSVRKELGGALLEFTRETLEPGEAGRWVSWGCDCSSPGECILAATATEK